MLTSQLRQESGAAVPARSGARAPWIARAAAEIEHTTLSPPIAPLEASAGTWESPSLRIAADEPRLESRVPRARLPDHLGRSLGAPVKDPRGPARADRSRGQRTNLLRGSGLLLTACMAMAAVVIAISVQRSAHSPPATGPAPASAVKPVLAGPGQVQPMIAAPAAAPVSAEGPSSALRGPGATSPKIEMPQSGQAAEKESPGAQQCPTAQSARSGFMVERGDQWKSEVLPGDGPVVRSVVTSRDGLVLETAQFEGLFPLDRLDRGRRTVFRPLTDLNQMFPLNPGKTLEAAFEIDGGSGQRKIERLVLTVTGTDVLSIGPCNYEVFKIERREARGEGEPQLKETDYFSPDLRLILGKSYKDKDGVTTLVKFDQIHPAKTAQ
jgi:hypothetical protein